MEETVQPQNTHFFLRNILMYNCIVTQALRDGMVRLEEQHHQDLNRQISEHKQIMEIKTAEQLSVREELRKHLAQVHMEKFSAMAAELTHVHKVRNHH